MNLNFGQGHHFQSAPEKYGEIGKLIDEKLIERGMSKSKFAKEMDMSPSYLAHIMRGQYDDSPKIPKIFKALGIKQDTKSA